MNALFSITRFAACSLVAAVALCSCGDEPSSSSSSEKSEAPKTLEDPNPEFSAGAVAPEVLPAKEAAAPTATSQAPAASSASRGGAASAKPAKPKVTDVQDVTNLPKGAIPDVNEEDLTLPEDLTDWGSLPSTLDGVDSAPSSSSSGSLTLPM